MKDNRDLVASSSRSSFCAEDLATSTTFASVRPTIDVPPFAALQRPRSHNGYGVDDLEPSPAALDQEKAQLSLPAVPLRDPFQVGWDGGVNHDPLSPRTMSTARKWLVTIIVSTGSFCVTCTSSIYVTTYVQMEAEFGSSRIMSTLGLSLFVLGLAFGPAVLSPLSEFYGRRPIYLVSFALFIIWLVPEIVAKNIGTVIAGRMLDGLSGSAFLSVSGGTVGDMFSVDRLAAPMMIFSLAPFVGPSLGPLVGGFINFNVDWKWTYYVLLIWAALLLTAIYFFVPETYHPVVLRNKAQALRTSTGDDRWKAPMEKTAKSIAETVARSLMRPVQMLVLEPMILCLCIYTAIILGILYLFFGAFPLIFRTTYRFELWQVGLTFLGILTGILFAAASDPAFGRIRSRLMAKALAEHGAGQSEPEYRFPAVMVGGLLAPVGLFWFAWTTMPEVHWLVPIVASSFFGAGCLLIFNGIYTFLVEAYPLYAASALAANSLVRCSFAAAFPLFGEQMLTVLGYQWASTVLALLTVFMAPFPFIFFKYGKRIRARSKFAAC